MDCPKCGYRLNIHGLCDVCLNVSPALPATLESAPTSINPPAQPAENRIPWWGFLCIGGALLLDALYAASSRSSPDAGDNPAHSLGFAFGTFLGALLIPAIVAHLVAGRKRNKNPKRYAIVFSALLVGVILLNAFGRLAQYAGSYATTNETQRLVEHAKAGDTTGLSNAEAFGANLVREILQRQADYLTKVEACTPKVRGLLTAETFASKVAMETTENDYKQCTDIDLAFYDDVLSIYAGVPGRVATQEWPQDEKDDFLKGFNNANKAPLKAIEDQRSSERLVQSSALALYDFARKNSAAIKVQNGKLVIGDTSVREEFNRLLTDCKTKHDQFRVIAEEARRNADRLLKENGLQRDDLKLKQ